MSNQLEELETSREKARTSIELGNSLRNLYDNPDFKKVFLNQFLEVESVKMVQIFGSSTNPDEIEEAKKAMYAISGLRKFMNTIINELDDAELSIREIEEAQEHLYNHGAV